MSANNELLIFKFGKEWVVFMNCCFDNDFPKPKTTEKALFKSKSKLKVFEWANDYCRKEIVEYGVHCVEN